MNLLEHYIVKIHKEEIFLMEEIQKDMYLVELTHDCYGQMVRETRTFFPSEWEDAKSKGYWLG